MAQSALPAVGTEALVGVESVDAGPSVTTGLAGTVIDVLGRGGKVLINTQFEELRHSEMIHSWETIIWHIMNDF